MNIGLALKIEQALNMEEGYFMILQLYYDIEEEKRKQNTEQPDSLKLRPVLFWDTKMEKIDWKKQKKQLLKEFLSEVMRLKKEITRFYGKEIVNEIISSNGG